jgi:Fe-Mn family superoxide dismutase
VAPADPLQIGNENQMTGTATIENATLHALPPLPYAENALDPVISAATIGFHYGKHHKTYVDNLNKLVPGTEYEGMTPEQIVNATAGKADKAGFFNNAAQVWNHTFYWNCLKPNGGGAPGGDLAAKIDAAFGGFDNFKKEFANAAVTQFGSGWAWLVADAGALKLSDLTVGGPFPSGGGEPTRPSVDYTVRFGVVHGFLEAYGPSSATATVRYEIARDEQSPCRRPMHCQLPAATPRPRTGPALLPALSGSGEPGTGSRDNALHRNVPARATRSAGRA